MTAFYAVQLTLCIKIRRTSVKLIPVWLLALCWMLIFALYMGVFGSGGGFLPGDKLSALVFAVIAGTASFGVALAWLTHIFPTLNKKT